MENEPFEDVFPFKNGDIPASYVSLPEGYLFFFFSGDCYVNDAISQPYRVQSCSVFASAFSTKVAEYFGHFVTNSEKESVLVERKFHDRFMFLYIYTCKYI